MGSGLGKRDAWIVIGLTLIAFVLRVYRLGATGFYYDEVFSLAIGTLPLPDLLIEVLDDRNTPPGYFLLGQLWYGIGRSEFVVRYLSIILGVLAVPAIYRLGKVVADARLGLIVAALLAVSPFHITHSQVARMYSMVTLFAIGANYFFLRLLERGRARDQLGYAVLTACGLYTHYFHAWIILAQMVFVVLARARYRAAVTRWLVALSGAGALFAPWFVVFVAAGGTTQARIAWIPPTNLSDLPLTLFAMSLGATSLVNHPVFFLVPGAFVALALGGWLGSRQAATRARANFLAIWFLLPIVLVFLISLDLPIANKRSVYADRYFIGELPALLLLIALGIRALWQKRPRVTAVVALALLAAILFTLQFHFHDPADAPIDWPRSVAYLRAQADPTRDVLTIYAGVILELAYYEPGITRRVVVELPSAQAPSAFDQQFAQFDPAPTHVWLVVPTGSSTGHGFPPSLDEQRAMAFADPLKRALDRRFALEEERSFPSVFITKYRVVK
jgi:asparagine N-glycosylation enzyme membrane subunit Stt3